MLCSVILSEAKICSFLLFVGVLLLARAPRTRYTSPVIRTALGFVLLYTFLPAAAAQVRITIPLQSFHVNDKIPARVENATSEAVTFCLEIGQRSTNGTTVEATPIPFIVQASSGDRWRSLLIGPDEGSLRRPVILEAGKSNEFPFRLDEHGLIRLFLEYWNGSNSGLDCSKPPKHAHKVKSKPFTLLMRAGL